MKLQFSKLDIYVEDDNVIDVRLVKDSESDLELIESCFEEASASNVTEKSMLYYICGYVANKEGIVCTDAGDAMPLPPKSEFTLKLSCGMLKLPPINLYALSQCYICIFLKPESAAPKSSQRHSRKFIATLGMISKTSIELIAVYATPFSRHWWRNHQKT